MAKFVLGQIDFINTWPVHHFLKLQNLPFEVEVRKGSPRELNKAMVMGEVMCAPISSIELLRHPDMFVVVPDLSISCDGNADSVIVISKMPIESINPKVIAATNQSATSVALFRVLAKYKYKDSYELTFFDHPEEMLNSLPAILLIGDKALQRGNNSNFNSADHSIHKLDLGMAWKELTGKPFVFALWAVNRQWATQNPKDFQYLCEELHRSKKEGLIARKQQEYIDKASAQLGLPTEIISAYYQNIKYDLNADKLEGLKYFDTYLRDMKIL